MGHHDGAAHSAVCRWSCDCPAPLSQNEDRKASRLMSQIVKVLSHDQGSTIGVGNSSKYTNMKPNRFTKQLFLASASTRGGTEHGASGHNLQLLHWNMPWASDEPKTMMIAIPPPPPPQSGVGIAVTEYRTSCNKGMASRLGT